MSSYLGVQTLPNRRQMTKHMRHRLELIVLMVLPRQTAIAKLVMTKLGGMKLAGVKPATLEILSSKLEES